MDLKKTFEVSDLAIMQNLHGKKLNDIFKQADLFVINFGNEEIEYSLHIGTFFRAVYKSQILLTDCDEYVYPNYKLIPESIYIKDEMHDKSLLKISLQAIKDLTHNAIVKNVSISETADLTIIFDNGVVFSAYVDCLYNNREHYRFFKYEEDSNNVHNIIKSIDGQIVFEQIGN